MSNLNYAECETKISQLLSEGKRSWEIISNLENDYDFFLIQVCYNNLINYKTKHNSEEGGNIEEEKNNITNLRLNYVFIQILPTHSKRKSI